MDKESQIVYDLGYSLRRHYVDQFFFRVVGDLPHNALVLDLGGHKENKRGKFDIEKYDLRVLYANLNTTYTPDVQADGAALPFADGTFDAVICGELLEHVPDPLHILQGVYRALKPGGVVLISVPFLFPMHSQPNDYARYTNFFWDKNLAKLGYQKIEIEIHGYYWSVLMDLIRYQFYDRATKRRPKPVWFRRLLANGVLRGVQWAIKKDQTPTYPTDPFYYKFTTGFGIRASK